MKSISHNYINDLITISKRLEGIHLPVPSTNSPFDHNPYQSLSDYLSFDDYNDFIRGIQLDLDNLQSCLQSSKNLMRCLDIVVHQQYSSYSELVELSQEYTFINQWLDIYKSTIEPSIDEHLRSVESHWNQLIDAESNELTEQEEIILSQDVEELTLIVNESQETLAEAEIMQKRSDNLQANFEKQFNFIQDQLNEQQSINVTINESIELENDIEIYFDKLSNDIKSRLKSSQELFNRWSNYLRMNEHLSNELKRQEDIRKEIERIRVDANNQIQNLYNNSQIKAEKFWRENEAYLPANLVETFRSNLILQLD